MTVGYFLQFNDVKKKKKVHGSDPSNGTLNHLHCLDFGIQLY